MKKRGGNGHRGLRKGAYFACDGRRYRERRVRVRTGIYEGMAVTKGEIGRSLDREFRGGKV